MLERQKCEFMHPRRSIHTIPCRNCKKPVKYCGNCNTKLDLPTDCGKHYLHYCPKCIDGWGTNDFEVFAYHVNNSHQAENDVENQYLQLENYVDKLDNHFFHCTIDDCRLCLKINVLADKITNQ